MQGCILPHSHQVCQSLVLVGTMDKGCILRQYYRRGFPRNGSMSCCCYRYHCARSHWTWCKIREDVGYCSWWWYYLCACGLFVRGEWSFTIWIIRLRILWFCDRQVKSVLLAWGNTGFDFVGVDRDKNEETGREGKISVNIVNQKSHWEKKAIIFFVNIRPSKHTGLEIGTVRFLCNIYKSTLWILVETPSKPRIEKIFWDLRNYLFCTVAIPWHNKDYSADHFYPTSPTL